MEVTRGFTLVELVIGIVVMGIAIAGITSVLFTFAVSSANPVFEVKSSLLADRIFREISAQEYDHNSDHHGGVCRCGEQVSSGTERLCAIGSCTAEESYGPDTAEERGALYASAFSDVDDFDTTRFCAKKTSGIVCREYPNPDYCNGLHSCSGVPADFFLGKNYAEWKAAVQQDLPDAGYADYYVTIRVTPVTVGGMTFKEIRATVLDPRGGVYRRSALRGNY